MLHLLHIFSPLSPFINAVEYHNQLCDIVRLMEELPSLLLSHIANESRERAEKEVAILVQEASKEIERLEEEKVRR